MTDKLFNSIAACRIFSAADPNVLRAALASDDCGEACFEAGETILTPEKNERRIGIILSGNAKVRSLDDGKNVLLKTLGVGEAFGVANLFECDANFVSRIVAGRDCRIFFVGYGTVSRLLESDRGFMYAYIEFLSGRIRFLNRKIMFYTSGSAERKLALYLNSFGCERVTPDLPMNALAELLDIGRASLYRAIDSLIEDGFVVRENTDFIIKSSEKMLKKYKI